MSPILLFAFALALGTPLWLVANWFRPRLEGRERVVMQWGLDLKPNSYARPMLALSATPALATAVLLLIAILASVSAPPAERGMALWGMIACSLAFTAVHAAHMHFAAKAE